MEYLGYFFTGAFLVNCIPHLASGLQGIPFPTPFAKPRGVGNSSPLVNFLWGFFNAVVGGCLWLQSAFTAGWNAPVLTALLGALLMGVYLSRHFGKVQRDRQAV